MATGLSANPLSFASVLANMARQGQLTAWDDDEDDGEEPPSPTRPVASYGHHARSGSTSSTSSSQDSFYTLYDEPWGGKQAEGVESEERSETPRARRGTPESAARGVQASTRETIADWPVHEPRVERPAPGDADTVLQPAIALSTPEGTESFLQPQAPMSSSEDTGRRTWYSRKSESPERTHSFRQFHRNLISEAFQSGSRSRTRTTSQESAQTLAHLQSKNAIFVSTTTTIQTTTPDSRAAETARRTPPHTETTIAAHADEAPAAKVSVDFSRPLPLRSQPIRAPSAAPAATVRTPLPSQEKARQPHPPLEPLQPSVPERYDDIITEEELLELEEEVTPRPRPRTKNLAKIFGQDPKHTYPPPLPSPVRPEHLRRLASMPEIPTLPRTVTPETSHSHIGDIRKKIAWRPTALSSAEEEADRKDLARLLGDDDTLVTKIFGEDAEPGPGRASSENAKPERWTPEARPSTSDSPRNKSRGSFSSSDWRRRPAWRPTAASTAEQAADARDLHELMLGNRTREAAGKSADDTAAERLPSFYRETSFDEHEPSFYSEASFDENISLSHREYGTEAYSTTNVAHEPETLGHHADLPRAAGAKRTSLQAFVADLMVRPHPSAALVPSTPPRLETGSTVAAANAGAAESDAESEATAADFSTFSGVYVPTPYTGSNPSISTPSVRPVPGSPDSSSFRLCERSSPGSVHSGRVTPTPGNYAYTEEPISRAGATTRTEVGVVQRIAAYIDPDRDLCRTNDTDPYTREEGLVAAGRNNSLSSDSTTSEASDSASPEVQRRESPLSETEGDEEEKRRGAQVTPTPGQGLLQLPGQSPTRHRRQPSGSSEMNSISEISSLSSFSTFGASMPDYGFQDDGSASFVSSFDDGEGSPDDLYDTDEEMSIISTHDLSQPPPHLLSQSQSQSSHSNAGAWRSHPSPLASHAVARPHTAPSPRISTFHPPSKPMTVLRPASPSSPSLRSLDSAAPPPIALVRAPPESPEANNARPRPRRFGRIRDTILLRRPSTQSTKAASAAEGGYEGTDRTDFSYSGFQPERETASSLHSKQTSHSNSSGGTKPPSRREKEFDDAALHELLSTAVPYERSIRAPAPFQTRQAAGVYPTAKRKGAKKVPLGLDMLEMWEMRDLMEQQRREKEARRLEREPARTREMQTVHEADQANHVTEMGRMGRRVGMKKKRKGTASAKIPQMGTWDGDEGEEYSGEEYEYDAELTEAKRLSAVEEEKE